MTGEDIKQRQIEDLTARLNYALRELRVEQGDEELAPRGWSRDAQWPFAWARLDGTKYLSAVRPRPYHWDWQVSDSKLDPSKHNSNPVASGTCGSALRAMEAADIASGTTPRADQQQDGERDASLGGRVSDTHTEPYMMVDAVSAVLQPKELLELQLRLGLEGETYDGRLRASVLLGHVPNVSIEDFIFQLRPSGLRDLIETHMLRRSRARTGATTTLKGAPAYIGSKTKPGRTRGTEEPSSDLVKDARTMYGVQHAYSIAVAAELAAQAADLAELAAQAADLAELVGDADAFLAEWVAQNGGVAR